MARHGLALVLAVGLAAPLAAQRVRVADEDGGTRVVANPVTVLQHVIQLQHQLLRAQRNLLFVFQDEWVRITKDEGHTPPERAAQLGVEIKGHLRLMNGLQGQLGSAFRMLMETDSSTWPTQLMLQFSELERELDEGRRQIDAGLEGIAAHVDMRAVGEVVLREAEPLDPADASAPPSPGTSTTNPADAADAGGDPDDDPDAPPIPEEAEAVGEKILAGDIATTDDVMMLFERLPGAPRGSLAELLRSSSGP